jgi:Domain of unknown function (DUF6980)
MTFRLTNEQMDQEIAADVAVCARYENFDRDEAGWDAIWDGVFAMMVSRKDDVRAVFGLDPRKSALFADFADLLWAACDPQAPVVYSPVFREFGLPVFDGGPSATTLAFDPWSGKALPPSVRDAYFDEAEKILGHEVGLLDDALDTLPDSFRSEAWWIERGL